MNIGSVSSGTLRTEDLLEAFADELAHQVKLAAPHPGALNPEHTKLIDEARDIDPDSDDAPEIVNELMDALNEYAPPYFYFGAHPGDGADFGYWLSDSMTDDFDGLKVDDTSEVPSDYSGEVLHVNDHGNMTLYTANHGELKEVWAVV